MRLSLILLLPGPITSFVVSSQQRKLHSLRSTRKAPPHKNHRTTMSSNPSALYTPQDIKGWTALVTGASSGFGKATAWRFAELGCKLIIVARRGDRLEALAGELKAKYGTEVFCLVLDMMDIERVEKMDELLPEQFRNVDILVNNAGLALGKNSVEENVTSDIVRMMTTNVTALIIATTLFTKGMKARGRGHVINVGSIAGHYAYGGGSGYCASKSAVTAFTSAARHDLVGTPIRVTCISPGFAETEFSLVRFEASENAADKAKSVYDNLVPMVAADIADQIVYAATRPAHVQIQDIIAWPTNQAGPTNIARVGPSLGAP
jgi:3-hydroxy acid dehydrogenase/malonic semialdehyde reductase